MHGFAYVAPAVERKMVTGHQQQMQYEESVVADWVVVGLD